ncbi:hypothetical protein STEG23_020501 [Scotinomys teguina]
MKNTRCRSYRKISTLYSFLKNNDGNSDDNGKHEDSEKLRKSKDVEKEFLERSNGRCDYAPVTFGNGKDLDA